MLVNFGGETAVQNERCSTHRVKVGDREHHRNGKEDNFFTFSASATLNYSKFSKVLKQFGADQSLFIFLGFFRQDSFSSSFALAFDAY